MTSKAPTVAAYLKELPEDRRAVMATLRKLIRNVAPRVTESMEYGMPCFFHDGKPFIAMNAQKHYFALYVAPILLTKHRKALGKLSCGKCCIRFRKLADLPMDVAKTIIRDSMAVDRQGQ